MPHLRLETTTNLVPLDRVGPILDALVDALSLLPTVRRDAIKASHRRHRVFAMGDATRPGFVHLEVAILSGRSLEMREDFADAMFDALRRQLPEIDRRLLSVEVREMAADTYRKG